MSTTFYRAANYMHRKSIPVLPQVVTLLGRVILGAHIPAQCKIGAGTKIAYGGSGVVIHPKAEIGSNCLISPGVVIGGRSGHGRLPVLEDGVRVYPGAKILGPVRIGRGAQIGANAVVVRDVAAGATVVAPLGREVQ